MQGNAMSDVKTAYKLLRVRRDGTLGPLFINRKQVIPIGEWIRAGNHPTKGYAHRPGWHSAEKPIAPHLSTKGRAWYRCSIDIYSVSFRPKCQGNRWYISKWIKIEGPA